MPLVAWRVFIGPLRPEIAAFESFTINVVYTWSFVSFLQVSTIIICRGANVLTKIFLYEFNSFGNFAFLEFLRFWHFVSYLLNQLRYRHVKHLKMTV